MSDRRRIMFSKIKKLPSEYQQVEYIYGNGGYPSTSANRPYINTGVPSSSKIGFDIKFNTPGTQASYWRLIGRKNTTNNKQWSYMSRWEQNNAMCFEASGNSVYMSATYNQDHVFEFKKDGTYKIDGVSGVISPISDEVELSIILFHYGTDLSWSDGFTGKVYYLKIYENDVMVRDMIPCYKKSNSEVGMYDLENDVFYTNQGSGSFTKGPDVN